MRRRFSIACLIIILLLMFSISSAAAKTSAAQNIFFKVVDVPSVRQPSTTMTVPILIGNLSDAAITVQGISLTVGGKELFKAKSDQKVFTVKDKITKDELEAALKLKKKLTSPQIRRAQGKLKAASSKLKLALMEINLKDAYSNLKAGDQIQLSIAGTFGSDGQTFSLQASYATTYQSPLPDVSADHWYPGDAHLHTYFSADNSPDSIHLYAPIGILPASLC